MRRDGWPETPHIEAIAGHQIDVYVAQLLSSTPKAVAVAFDSNWLTQEPRTRVMHLPQFAAGGHIAIACLSHDGKSRVALLSCAHPSDIAKLAVLLENTYTVFFHGHPELALLSEHGVFPTRLGSVHTALHLLAMGRRQVRAPTTVTQALGYFEATLGQYPVGPMTLAPQSLALDAWLQLWMLQQLTAELRSHHLASVFEMECKLLPAVVSMESAGIALDQARFEEIARGWVVASQTEENPATQARLQKLVSTYRHWSRDYCDYDGRIRCHLDPLASESGRFSCSNPNLQQVPSEHTAPGVRTCFHAAPGHKLIIADYSQIELRVAAHLAPCPALRQVFQDHRDPHRATAATLARKPEHEVDNHERQLAKAVNFGFLFGMGATRFREYAQRNFGLQLSLEQANAARAGFFRTFPGISSWHQRIAREVRDAAGREYRVQTAMGRVKIFDADKASFSAALNIPVQGTAAEGFKRAMIDLHAELPKLGGRGVLCVHDEYLAEVPSERAEEGKLLVTTLMQSAMSQVVTSVPIVVQAQIADNWGSKG